MMSGEHKILSTQVHYVATSWYLTVPRTKALRQTLSPSHESLASSMLMQCSQATGLAGNGHPKLLQILWVRWYQYTSPMHTWTLTKLDRIRFPPMADADAFGFLDPGDVMRACHIVLAYSKGKLHTDGVGISRIA
jgi:hypothetical protein